MLKETLCVRKWAVCRYVIATDEGYNSCMQFREISLFRMLLAMFLGLEPTRQNLLFGYLKARSFLPRISAKPCTTFVTLPTLKLSQLHLPAEKITLSPLPFFIDAHVFRLLFVRHLCLSDR